MKKIFLIALLLFNYCYGQDCEDILKQFNNEMEQGNYDKAQILAEKAVLNCRFNSSPDSLNYAVACFDLGVLYSVKEEKLDIAEQYLKIALKIISRENGKENDFYILVLRFLANISQLKGDFKAEIPIKEEMLQLQKKIKGTYSVESLIAIQELIDSHLEVENFKTSQKLYNECISIFDEISKNINEIKNLDQIYSWFAKYNETNRNYSSAEFYYNKSLEQIRISLGEDHIKYIRTLFYLSFCYKSQSDYLNQQRSLDSIILILEKSNRESAPEYLTAKLQLAKLSQRNGQYTQADSLYNFLLSIYRSTNIKKDNNYVALLLNIASLKEEYGDVQKGVDLIEEAVLIESKNNSENTLYYLELIYRLSQVYYNNNQYDSSKNCLEKGIEIAKKNSFNESMEYFQLIKGLSIFYIDQSDITSAKKLLKTFESDFAKQKFESIDKVISYKLVLFELYKGLSDAPHCDKIILEIETLYVKNNRNQSIEFLEFLRNKSSYYSVTDQLAKVQATDMKIISLATIIYGENNWNLSNIYYDVALHFDNDNNNEASLLYIKKAYSIQFQNNNINSISYAKVIQHMGLVFLNMGSYAQADSLINTSLEITKKLVSENNPFYVSSLHNLALVYQTNEQFQKSLSYYKRVIEISQKIKKPLDRGDLQTYKNLGALYYEFGYFNLADSIYDIAQNIIDKLQLSNVSLDFLDFIEERAIVYKWLGYFDKAESLLLNACKGYENTKYESKYADCLNNLGLLYSLQDQHQKAINLLNKSIIITKKIRGKDKYYSTRLSSLAYSYDRINSHNTADSLYSESANVLDSLINLRVDDFTYREAFNYIERKDHEISPYFKFLTFHPNTNTSMPLLNLCLNRKYKLLNKFSSFYIKDLAVQDAIYDSTYKLYTNTRAKIAFNFQSGRDSLNNLLYNLQDSLEKALVNKINNYKKYISKGRFDWKEIQFKLNQDEAAIDFETFQVYNDATDKWTDTIMYVAFLIKRNSKIPIYKVLFTENQLQNIVEEANNANGINQLYSNTINSESDEGELYKLLWSPLDSTLNGIKRIYISPAGLLHKVSFSAIPIQGGGRLIDKYDIVMMSNIKDIVASQPSQKKSIKSAALFGDIDYNSEPSSISPISVKNSGENLNLSITRGLNSMKWSDLKATASEISNIKSIINNNSIVTNLYTRENASEENFKKNTSNASIIHIATHGFSIVFSQNAIKERSGSKNKVIQNSEDPLTRSGLILAGGNQMWVKGITFQNHEDGVLTSREVSTLDLKDCELATLSACETGLGGITSSEGVFGLKRAFKMAGVHYLIVSLWKVPDAETAVFMQTFYSNWLEGKYDIKDAFRKTQLEMSIKYQEPYKWAGFILIN